MIRLNHSIKHKLHLDSSDHILDFNQFMYKFTFLYPLQTKKLFPPQHPPKYLILVEVKCTLAVLPWTAPKYACQYKK